MTTVVNNPAPAANADGSNFLIGVIALIGFVMIILYFGIPVIQRMGAIQIKVPAPQIVVPEKINVNVQQTK